MEIHSSLRPPCLSQLSGRQAILADHQYQESLTSSLSFPELILPAPETFLYPYFINVRRTCQIITILRCASTFLMTTHPCSYPKGSALYAWKMSAHEQVRLKNPAINPPFGRNGCHIFYKHLASLDCLLAPSYVAVQTENQFQVYFQDNRKSILKTRIFHLTRKKSLVFRQLPI